jgi:carbon storage regulator
MLILTRKPDQRIIINENIVISVLAVDGDRVKIGISAPAEVPVLREEVRRAVGGENRSAAAHTTNRRELERQLLGLRRGALSPAPGASRA